MKFVSTLLFVALVTTSAWGQIAAWNLTSTTTTATALDANLTASAVTVAPSTTVSYQASPGDIYCGTWPTSSTFSTAGKYWQFSITPNSGYQIAISSLMFKGGATSTGPQKLQVQYSLDGFTTSGTTALGESPNTNTSSLTQFTLTGLPSTTTNVVTFRIWGYAASSTGNFRLNNIVINGTVTSTGGTPTKLVVTTINGSLSPSANTPFGVVIQSQDNSGVAQAVSANTDVTLSLATGSGSLGGTLTGTISAGTNSVTISGVTYNTAESGVSITATRTSGDALSAGTSSTFTVLSAASKLAFVNVPSGGQKNVSLASFTVQAQRSDNSIDQNYTASIALSKGSGPGNIFGTLSKPAVAGVATFNDIKFDASGSYTISASATGPTSATSGMISVLSTALPLVETFDYTPGTTLVSDGWTAHSGAGSNSITVASGALTYSGYVSSGVGNKVTVGNTGEDVNRIFDSVSTGYVYASFLANISAANTAGDYFFHLGPAGTTSAFYARVFAKVDGSNNLAFGIAKNVSASVSYTPFSYSLNTTYLIAVKYIFNSGTTTDDQVELWINPSLSVSEPAPEVTQTDAGTDATALGMVAFRQGTAANAPTLTLSGLRVATGWTDAPLPVTMKGITAKVSAGQVHLSIATATEINVAGFNVSRSLSKNGPFELISSYASNPALRTSGSATTGGSYLFVDSKVSGGETYYYKIECVNKSGAFEQVGEILQVNVALPKDYAVYQNYPKGYVAKEDELEV